MSEIQGGVASSSGVLEATNASASPPEENDAPNPFLQDVPLRSGFTASVGVETAPVDTGAAFSRPGERRSSVEKESVLQQANGAGKLGKETDPAGAPSSPAQPLLTGTEGVPAPSQTPDVVGSAPKPNPAVPRPSQTGDEVAVSSAGAKTGMERVQSSRVAKPAVPSDKDNKQGGIGTTASSSTGGEANASAPVKASSPFPNDVRGQGQQTSNAGIAASPPNTFFPQGSGSRDNPVATPSSEQSDQSAALRGKLDPANVPAVNSAQLIQSVHRSEMRLGMQSAEFGNISISTSLNHQSLSAQISVDHPELGRALAVHLPAMEQKLGSAYGLQAKVDLNGGNSSASTASGQDSQGGRQQQSGNKVANPLIAGVAPVSTAALPMEIVATGSVRLDIRI
jgi:hypothetical protein